MGICGIETPISIAGFILTVISFIIHLIGFALPFWNYKSNVGLTEYYGLWQYCVSGDNHTNCTSLSCDDGMNNPWCTSAWKATQALEILGLLSLFIAVAMVSLQMFKFRDRRIPKLAGISCCFIGGVVILIGVIVYGTQEGIDKNSFHFAFAFCILAAIGSVIAAVLLIIGHRLARTTDSRRMDTGLSLNTIEQNASNDEADNLLADNEDQIELGELKDSIAIHGLDVAFKNFTEKLDNWKNEPVKLAVTGKSGVGKSSFINAIRHLKSGDPGFATASGSGNTTKNATVYEYPGNKKITLHDLPGFGTTEFPKYEYEKRMALHTYDYILIVVANIDENDIALAKILKEMHKPFCFVRSKIDIDIANATTDGESETEAIEKIKSKALNILWSNGFKEGRFFVISNHNLSICDFDELVSYIKAHLPRLKCEAVVFSLLGELTDGAIDSKYNMFKGRLWKVSMASAVVAATPVPGIDVGLNIAIICHELCLYHTTFGFGQDIVKEILKHDYLGKKLSASSIIKIDATSKAMQAFVILQLGKLGTLMAIENALDYIFPIIGSIVSGTTAFAVTYSLLTRILDSCRGDANLVYSHLIKVKAQKEREKQRLGQQMVPSPHSNYMCCRSCRS